MSAKKRTFPWTELYNLESQLGQRPLPGLRRRGRPPRPFTARAGAADDDRRGTADPEEDPQHAGGNP